jgi:hypothetical protein
MLMNSRPRDNVRLLNVILQIARTLSKHSEKQEYKLLIVQSSTYFCLVFLFLHNYEFVFLLFRVLRQRPCNLRYYTLTSPHFSLVESILHENKIRQ